MSVRDEVLRLLGDPHEHEFRSKVSEALLGDTIAWPAAFKSALVPYVESANVQVPISQITGNFLVADTTADLGGNIHGRTGMVRVGTTPYDYFQLVYDAVEDQWVSSFFVAMAQVGADDTYAFSTLSTSYVHVFRATSLTIPLAPFVDAGLKLQVRLGAGLGADASTTATSAMLFYAHDGDEVFGFGTESSWTISRQGSGINFRDSGWQDIPGTVDTDKDFLGARILLKTSDGAVDASIWNAICWARWVSS